MGLLPRQDLRGRGQDGGGVGAREVVGPQIHRHRALRVLLPSSIRDRLRRKVSIITFPTRKTRSFGTPSFRRFRAPDSFRPDRAWKSGATFMKLGRAPATSIIVSCFTVIASLSADHPIDLSRLSRIPQQRQGVPFGR